MKNKIAKDNINPGKQVEKLYQTNSSAGLL
jgi:hypothetical protein